MTRPAVFCFLLMSTGVFGCFPMGKGAVPVWKAKVSSTFPHDVDAYTQGLTIANGRMLEGTGKYGNSSLREVELKSGLVLKSVPLGEQYFGEGITVLGNKIYQLTWKNNLCFVYDLETLQYQEHFRYTYEGWGLTNNGTELIVSDGSSDIRFVDPTSFKELRKISVKHGNERIKNLNELEYIDGEIWANVWYEDRIARISQSNGQLLGWIDLGDIYPKNQRREKDQVLNGIARDPASKKIFVTGKNWANLFEIEIAK